MTRSRTDHQQRTHSTAWSSTTGVRLATLESGCWPDPVRERQLELAGVSTAVLEGGDGPPVVRCTARRVRGPLDAGDPELVRPIGGRPRPARPRRLGRRRPLDADHVQVARGADRAHLPVPARAGGPWAWRRYPARLRSPTPTGCRAGAGGRVRPEPIRAGASFGLALNRFLEQPTERTRDGLFEQCFVDLGGLRQQVERWSCWRPTPWTGRARRAEGPLGRLMPQFGLPAIPPAELERIAVPTTLVWGRQDLQVRCRRPRPPAPAMLAAARDRQRW